MISQRVQEPWNTELPGLPGWQLQQNRFLCRAFVFEDASHAFDFARSLCKVAKERHQKPSFRVRDGHVFVQCAVPSNGESQDLQGMAKDLNNLRSSLP